VEDLEAGVAGPVGGEDHEVRVGAARRRQQQSVVRERVGGAAETAARGHVIGCELGRPDAEALEEIGIGEVQDAGKREFERVDGAPGA